MGFLSKALKSGIAVKVVNEARKPHNQQKIKDAVASFRNKGTNGNKGNEDGGTAGTSSSTPSSPKR